METHMDSFIAQNMDPRAWTPQAAMEAVLAARGEKAMQAYWEMQLDGGLLNMGVWRAGETMVRNSLERGWWDGGIANLGIEKECSICGGSREKCEEVNREQKDDVVDAKLAYDATKR